MVECFYCRFVERAPESRWNGSRPTAEHEREMIAYRDRWGALSLFMNVCGEHEPYARKVLIVRRMN